MMKLPRKVVVKEVGPRDGFQMEKKFVPTENKIEVIDLLSRCGFEDIQFTAFVHPKAVPNMADSEEVAAKIKRPSGVEFTALIPNRKGYERAHKAGFKRVEITLSATDSHNMSNLNCTTMESLARLEECLALGLSTEICGGIAVVFGCPFEGRPPYERIKMIVDRMVSMGIKDVGLADTSGVGDPVQVYDICSRLLDAHPHIHYYFHAHNTHGTAVANILAAMQAGLLMFDSSVAGLGGCPYAPGASGNVATEDLVQILEYMGIETGVDIDKLITAARRTAEIVGHSDSATLRAGKMGRLVEGGPVCQNNQ
ncbi:MAG: hydroxymethylglutaryl-CoA lyase [Spirochaetales bacterium]|jgi:hydroxymethylglutaryl-CoA lyase|nr:hydroxymethylglutaryl-CoA lyase [Spirochaetales bacterium]